MAQHSAVSPDTGPSAGMRATAGNCEIDATAEVDFASATDLLPYPVEGKRLESALSSIPTRTIIYSSPQTGSEDRRLSAREVHLLAKPKSACPYT